MADENRYPGGALRQHRGRYEIEGNRVLYVRPPQKPKTIAECPTADLALTVCDALQLADRVDRKGVRL